MSRFTDLFQEPAPAPEPTPEPVKVEEVVVEKPLVAPKPAKKKFTIDWWPIFELAQGALRFPLFASIITLLKQTT